MARNQTQTEKAARELGRKQMEEAVDRYFTACREREVLPNMAGLSLALCYPGRRELEQDMEAPKARWKGILLKQARTRIEDETIQAACSKDTSSGAKFILQTEFGYSERETPFFGGTIEILPDPGGASEAGRSERS